jgi:hypothetical protein
VIPRSADERVSNESTAQVAGGLFQVGDDRGATI